MFAYGPEIVIFHAILVLLIPVFGEEFKGWKENIQDLFVLSKNGKKRFVNTEKNSCFK